MATTDKCEEVQRFGGADHLVELFESDSWLHYERVLSLKAPRPAKQPDRVCAHVAEAL